VKPPGEATNSILSDSLSHFASAEQRMSGPRIRRIHTHRNKDDDDDDPSMDLGAALIERREQQYNYSFADFVPGH
jgi:hypothetical protein